MDPSESPQEAVRNQFGKEGEEEKKRDSITSKGPPKYNVSWELVETQYNVFCLICLLIAFVLF